MDLSDRSNEACLNEANRETSLIDCETDLVRFEVPDEISCWTPSGSEDRPESGEDRDPNNSHKDELRLDSESDDISDGEVDFDQTGDLVDSLMEESVNKAAA